MMRVLERGVLKALEQVPALTLFVLALYVFIAHLDKRNEVLAEALNKNTLVMGKVLTALDRINGTHSN